MDSSYWYLCICIAEPGVVGCWVGRPPAIRPHNGQTHQTVLLATDGFEEGPVAEEWDPGVLVASLLNEARRLARSGACGWGRPPVGREERKRTQALCGLIR